MSALNRLLIWVMLVALLAGCAAPAATAPTLDRATTQLLDLQITPTLRGLTPLLSECARQQWTLGLVINERPANLIDLSGGGLALRWGAPDRLSEYAAVVGQDTLTLVVHPDNPVQRLTRAQVQAIFNGSSFTWGSFLQPECKDCAADRSGDPYAGKEIHAWAYTAGEDIRQIFEANFGMQISPAAAGTAPNAEAARQAVVEDPQAIAFIPARLVDSSVRVVEITGLPDGSLTVPVLVLAKSEPQGLARQWVTCVADKLK